MIDKIWSSIKLYQQQGFNEVKHQPQSDEITPDHTHKSLRAVNLHNGRGRLGRLP